MRYLVLATALVLAQPVAHAAPQGPEPAAAATTPADDAIMRLLGDRGLLKPLGAPVAMVQSLRESVRDTASDLVMTAMNFLGVPYRRGGNTADSGFDCSGFTRHIFENSLGLVLPRRADEQATTAGLLPINRSELKPGDLVFFNTMKRTFSHVGIYVGDDKFIHAPRAGAEVRIEDMRESYWARRFTGARRADLAAAVTSPGQVTR
ncbi:C40 family peptidase [Aquabacterium sp. OR-4]|uniref:C40 family peptidase n=1 Tax=Aquabacterium sp. OR-4 TaxID=2978127 RepID=UPI0021B30698|nr:C40 family peptidase [Aquabacterium sp. OR-4]MDT7835538.1 C40 family peptidase [Aquabacterium sp. OR-4]